MTLACIRMSWLQRRPSRILVPVLLAVVFLYLFFAQTKTHNLKVNQQRKRAREQLDNINAVLQAVKEKIPTTPTKLRTSTPDKEEKLSHYKTSDEVGEIVETKKKRIKTRSSKKRSHIKKRRKSKATRKNRNKQKHEHRFKFLNKVRPRDNESYSISGKKESHLNKKSHVTRVENEVRNKNICKIEFDYGDVCPPLYTELGGYCKHVKALGDVMDCPDIRRKGRTKLRSTQIVLTRMLKIFDIIAHKYNISYWITSGTLLGAVRHHGFIPWDEDADIQMFFDDYVKLFNCCKDVFPKGMFFQNSETDPHLGPSNRQEKMDLFEAPVGLYKQPWNPRLRDMASCTQYCLSEKCQWEDGLMIDIFIAEDTLTPYKRKGVFPLKQMIFEGFRFSVPNNWRDILQSKYGNYESDIGEDDSRQPQDNADPHHSCRQLEKRRKKRKTKKKKKIE